MSQDLGNVAAGFNNNFAYGTLAVGSNDYVRLVDLQNNSGSSSPEALYVNTLIVPSGSTLDLNGLHLYYRAGEIKGTITARVGNSARGRWPASTEHIRPRVIFSLPARSTTGPSSAGRVSRSTSSFTPEAAERRHPSSRPSTTAR